MPPGPPGWFPFASTAAVPCGAWASTQTDTWARQEADGQVNASSESFLGAACWARHTGRAGALVSPVSAGGLAGRLHCLIYPSRRFHKVRLTPLHRRGVCGQRGGKLPQGVCACSLWGSRVPVTPPPSSCSNVLRGLGTGGDPTSWPHLLPGPRPYPALLPGALRIHRPRS